MTKQMWLQNAGFVWVPFILMSTAAAWFGMNDLASAKSSFKEQSVIFSRKHNWLMCILYLGTFGSFLGFSAGFPKLTQTLFPDVNPAQYAFLGPLIGALTRSAGGWVSSKLGGAKTTQVVFVGMIAGIIGVLMFLPSAPGQGGSFWGFFACFMALFALSGLGNASTFVQVPLIFSGMHQKLLAAGKSTPEKAVQDANREAAAVIGFTAAFAGYGGFLIPKSFGTSLDLTGSANAALIGFVSFYVVCAAINWWYYARKNAEAKC